MLIRREASKDHEAIRAVLAEAFEDPQAPHDTPVEVGLVDALRESPEWLPALADRRRVG